MTSQDHEHYFAGRERQCRTLAETHHDPFLRRIYQKFADNYAKALRDKDRGRMPSQARTNGNHPTSSARKPERPTA